MNRREVITGAGMGLLAFSVGGCAKHMTAAEARENAVPFATLTDEEAELLEAVGETLAPGAAKAGIAHYVDQQISGPPADAFLTLRYMDVPPPYIDFYRPALAATDLLARKEWGAHFRALSSADRTALIAKIAAEIPQAWKAAPAPLVYFVLRADAIDVVYGTMAGFERLGVPYMAHIEPDYDWRKSDGG